MDDKTRENILNLITQRNEAKKEKNYQKADEIRDELLNLGILHYGYTKWNYLGKAMNGIRDIFKRFTIF